MTPAPRSAVYVGRVAHLRSGAAAHRLAYPFYFFGVDVDELPALSARLRLFGHNRPALFAIHDRDYSGGAAGLREAALEVARCGGVTAPIATIELLTQPRVAGFVFNPVSFYLCRDASAALVCVVAEVANTYGGRHRYLLWDGNRIGAGAYRTDKAFYVSPYIHDAASYEWRFRAAGGRRAVGMRVVDRAGRPFFRAAMVGRPRPLTDATLAWLSVRFPFQPARILARIHARAWWLRRRGVEHRPPPPADTAWR